MTAIGFDDRGDVECTFTPPVSNERPLLCQSVCKAVAIRCEVHTHEMSTFRELQWATSIETSIKFYLPQKPRSSLCVATGAHDRSEVSPGKSRQGWATAPQRAQHVQRPCDRSMTFEELRHRSVLATESDGRGRVWLELARSEQVRALPAISRFEPLF